MGGQSPSVPFVLPIHVSDQYSRPKVSRLSERISRIERLLAENLTRDQISGTLLFRRFSNKVLIDTEQNVRIRLNLLGPVQRPAIPPAPISPQTRHQLAFISQEKNWASSAYLLARHFFSLRVGHGLKLVPGKVLQLTDSAQHKHHGKKSVAKPSIPF